MRPHCAIPLTRIFHKNFHEMSGLMKAKDTRTGTCLAGIGKSIGFEVSKGENYGICIKSFICFSFSMISLLSGTPCSFLLTDGLYIIKR